MGPLASQNQVGRVEDAVGRLAHQQKVVYGPLKNYELQGAAEKKDIFSAVLFENNDPSTKSWCTK